MANDKMRVGQTYHRAPSKGQQIISNTSGSTNSGKITSRKGPQVVNNSTQGRSVPKSGK